MTSKELPTVRQWLIGATFAFAAAYFLRFLGLV